MTSNLGHSRVDREVLDESHVWRLPTAGVRTTVDMDYLTGYLTCT
jgi:hypothetical protein